MLSLVNKFSLNKGGKYKGTGENTSEAAQAYGRIELTRIRSLLQLSGFCKISSSVHIIITDTLDKS